jgi:hypothetical protein
LRYGRLTHRCSRCNADLTNALSAKLNIGPVCGKYWHPDEAEWTRIKADARAWLRDRGIDPTVDLPDNVDLTALEAATA